MVGSVEGKVIAANGAAGHGTDHALYHSLRRIAEHETDRATSAVSANCSQPSKLLQVWNEDPIGSDIEAHAGNENSIEMALQNCRKTFIPNRINEDKRFGSQRRSA